ncbi:DUF4411 family protein [Candidatus Micrarchaeota archaeon]|nr:DUF4411 family protein [Candidatus Micrarchaeota archaeon]MBU2476009.1 DUF4411 family protein [Candidatus Micrarchaeota archaeon]
MTETCYVIDTSSLVKLNRENPLDVYPGVWNKLEELVNTDRLIAPIEVLREISNNDDQLTKWAKKQKKMFREPTVEQMKIVKEILKDYPALIDVERKFDADSWVIALAIELSRNPQKKIVNIKRIVVTEEKLRGEKVKIPFVCQKYSIEAIDIITVFRTERWKFY